jgi:ADP-heptose:LPS heptosyltransferase
MEQESMTKLDKPLNILVKRRAAIGDVIMSTGVVRELKRTYKNNANIYVATDCIEVFKNNPHVTGVVPFDAAKNEQFDVVYNLDDAYEANRGIHYVDSYFYRVFGDVNINRAVELFPDDADQSRVLNLLVKNELLHEEGKYIVVHLRNWHWQAKNISLDVWFDVFTKLFEVRDDFKIVTIGGHTDHTVDHPNFVDLRNEKLTSQQMMLLCDQAQCFVGIDSGPFQCAAASKTQIIALLTHLAPQRISPYRKWLRGLDVTAITTNEDCKGCNDRQQMPVRQIICEKGDYPCVNNFDTQAIADAILRTL